MSLSKLYEIYQQNCENKAFVSHIRKIQIDDADDTVDPGPHILSFFSGNANPEKNVDYRNKDLQFGLISLFPENLCHVEPVANEKGKSWGISLGAGLKRWLESVPLNRRDSVEKAIHSLFCEDNLYLFLIGLRRLLARNSASLRVDLDRLERDIRSKFKFDNEKIARDWAYDLYLDRKTHTEA